MKTKPIHENILTEKVINILRNADQPLMARDIFNRLDWDGNMARLTNALTQLTNAKQVARSGNSGRYKYAIGVVGATRIAPMKPLRLDYLKTYRRSDIQDAPSLTVERHREQMRNKLRVESVYNRQAAD